MGRRATLRQIPGASPTGAGATPRGSWVEAPRPAILGCARNFRAGWGSRAFERHDAIHCTGMGCRRMGARCRCPRRRRRYRRRGPGRRARPVRSDRLCHARAGRPVEDLVAARRPAVPLRALRGRGGDGRHRHGQDRERRGRRAVPGPVLHRARCRLRAEPRQRRAARPAVAGADRALRAGRWRHAARRGGGARSQDRRIRLAHPVPQGPGPAARRPAHAPAAHHGLDVPQPDPQALLHPRVPAGGGGAGAVALRRPGG